MSPAPLEFRPIADRDLLDRFIAERWAVNGRFMGGWIRPARQVEAVGAYEDGALVGVATWALTKSLATLHSLDSLGEGRGIGSALIVRVAEEARRVGARYLRATVTNDNLVALGFLQRRGFRLTALYPGAVQAYAHFLPDGAAAGQGGIPCRDAIELELGLE